MSCDVGEVTERLENELCSFSNPSVALPTSLLILQPFRRFTYVTAHLQSLRRFTYVTAHSPILPLLHLCHSSFFNPSFASPTSQALHLIHLASHPWYTLDSDNREHTTFQFNWSIDFRDINF